MTTLYRPVLIESAEQAEALPVDTIAYQDRYNKWGELVVATKVTDAGDGAPPMWAVQGVHVRCPEIVGWTALVPIEAEEEHVAPDAITYSRYVTAWEEA